MDSFLKVREEHLLIFLSGFFGTIFHKILGDHIESRNKSVFNFEKKSNINKRVTKKYEKALIKPDGKTYALIFSSIFWPLQSCAIFWMDKLSSLSYAFIYEETAKDLSELLMKN